MHGSLFRSRLSKSFDDRTAKFHTSVPEDIRIFEDDINNTIAHDIMLYEQGIIPLKELKMILTALNEVRQKWKSGEIEVGLEYEDIHEYIEVKVIERIGIETGGMIHTGRSRNDQVVCDIKLRLREDLLTIANAALELVEVLVKRAKEQADTLMILYTHGQHAQIGSFGAYLTSYASVLLRDYQRLIDCYNRVNINPLGAGPIGGTSIPINRQRTTELLGFDSIQESSIDATSSRDWAVESASCCSTIMGNLSRIAADLLEWSTFEFAYVELADQYASSSSIMPQKKNPSTIELLRGKTGEAYSAHSQLLTMEKGVGTGYYQDLQETKLILWRTLDNTLNCLEIMTGAIGTMKINKENLYKKTIGSFTMATELAETLATEAGLSFRESYKISADLVNLCISKNQTLDKITPADVDTSAKKLYKKQVRVSTELIEKATDPWKSLLRRKSLGNPNPGEVKRMTEAQSVALSEGKFEVNKRKVKIESALKTLMDTAEKLAI